MMKLESRTEKESTLVVTEPHYGDCPDRPAMNGILVPGKRGRIFSTLYTAGGPGLHPAVLMFHGIPGGERNLDLAQALRQAGFHVMTFHYSGCWGSDGDYTIANDLEDANTVLDYLMADETHSIDKSRVYAVGHSLGGFVCGHITAKRPEIKGGVLLMPIDFGQVAQLEREGRADAVRDVMRVSAPWLTGATPEKLFQEILDNSAAFSVLALAGELAKKPLLSVNAAMDTATPFALYAGPLLQAIREAGGTDIEEVHYNTDHLFSDYRVTIIQKVQEYLSRLAFEG